MKKKINKKRFALLIAITVFFILIIYRYNILFAFQCMRLKYLPCMVVNKKKPIKNLKQIPACDKFWPHRVNSKERLIYLSDYFDAFETDIVFDKTLKRFRINHPPATPENLFIEEYFEYIKTNNKSLWLDVKNIDTADIEEAIRFFVMRDSIYNVKNNIIIESSEIKFVNGLAKAGFIASFLVPGQYILSIKGVPPQPLPIKLLEEVSYVSQEDTYIDNLKETFPQKKIITWAVSFKNYFDLTHFKSLLADTSIKIVLINAKTANYK